MMYYEYYVNFFQLLMKNYENYVNFFQLLMKNYENYGNFCQFPSHRRCDFLSTFNFLTSLI